MTSKNNEFYFDLEDFETVKQNYWILDSKHNVITKSFDGHRINMPVLLLGEGQYIHLNGNNADNRKHNLISTRGYKNVGKTKLNGYIAIYMPEHPRAFGNGCVYEHILVAEQVLQRPLYPNECVHHKDYNRCNNNPNNIVVFATDGDHTYFHNHPEVEIIKQINGSYVCKKNENSIGSKDVCPVCKDNFKEKRAKMCYECRRKESHDRMESKIPSKEALQKLIQKHSFVRIGEMFDVSDNTIRTWCKKRNLPTKRKDIKAL